MLGDKRGNSLFVKDEAVWDVAAEPEAYPWDRAPKKANSALEQEPDPWLETPKNTSRGDDPWGKAPRTPEAVSDYESAPRGRYPDGPNVVPKQEDAPWGRMRRKRDAASELGMRPAAESPGSEPVLMDFDVKPTEPIETPDSPVLFEERTAPRASGVFFTTQDSMEFSEVLRQVQSHLTESYSGLITEGGGGPRHNSNVVLSSFCRKSA